MFYGVKPLRPNLAVMKSSDFSKHEMLNRFYGIDINILIANVLSLQGRIEDGSIV